MNLFESPLDEDYFPIVVNEQQLADLRRIAGQDARINAITGNRAERRAARSQMLREMRRRR